MLSIKKIKLDNIVIPCIPFVWYRMQEHICPIDAIINVTKSKIKEIYDANLENKNGNIDVIIQRHIAENGVLYCCLHSLTFYELHKDKNENDNSVLIIPNNFNKNTNYKIKIIPLNNTIIDELHGGLKMNEFVLGNVYIHDMAFSPQNCLHFRVDNTKEKSEFICHIICEELNIDREYLFILFNDLKGISIDDKIKLLMDNFNKK